MFGMIVTALVWLGRIGTAAFAINEIRKFTANHKEGLAAADAEASNAGMTEDEKKKLAAAGTYEQVEKDGEDPEDFWAGLTESEKEALQFSPTSLKSDMQRTKFLGFTSAFLFIAAAVATGVAAFRGLPVGLNTIMRVGEARAKGASALQIATILDEGKLIGIGKVWVPMIVAGLASAGGWLTSSMTNNLNDASLWGRIFLGQAADDYNSAKEQLSKGGGSYNGPRTTIRIVTDAKPQQFIGTLFSAKLGSVDSFERQVDDEITSMDDLTEDVKINLNRWLASLPNRMGYSVRIQKDPIDEYGTQQSGVWATLVIFITHISGKISPIDTILLGPVQPKVRLEIQKTSKSIENDIQGFINATEVREIQVPSGAVDIFTPSGERTTLSGGFITESNLPASNAVINNEEQNVKSESTVAPTATPLFKGNNDAIDKSIKAEKQKRIDMGLDPVTGLPAQRPLPPEVQGFNGGQIGGKLKGVNLYINQAITTDTPNSVLNMRSAPNPTAKVITQLPDKTKLAVGNQYLRGGGIDWLFVKRGVKTGWVAVDYIKGN